jgi:hypothetical protein
LIIFFLRKKPGRAKSEKPALTSNHPNLGPPRSYFYKRLPWKTFSLQVDFGGETTMLPMTDRREKISLGTIKNTARNAVGLSPHNGEQRPN